MRASCFLRLGSVMDYTLGFNVGLSTVQLIFTCFILIYILPSVPSGVFFLQGREYTYIKSQSLHSSLASFQRTHDGEAN
jgi:hypothetical protein